MCNGENTILRYLRSDTERTVDFLDNNKVPTLEIDVRSFRNFPVLRVGTQVISFPRKKQ